MLQGQKADLQRPVCSLLLLLRAWRAPYNWQTIGRDDDIACSLVARSASSSDDTIASLSFSLSCFTTITVDRKSSLQGKKGIQRPEAQNRCTIELTAGRGRESFTTVEFY